MFYVKTQLGDSTAITTEITDENVCCRCPRCGEEAQVDLMEVLKEDADLYGTQVLCDECSRRWMEVHGYGE